MYIHDMLNSFEPINGHPKKIVEGHVGGKIENGVGSIKSDVNVSVSVAVAESGPNANTDAIDSVSAKSSVIAPATSTSAQVDAPAAAPANPAATTSPNQPETTSKPNSPPTASPVLSPTSTPLSAKPTSPQPNNSPSESIEKEKENLDDDASSSSSPGTTTNLPPSTVCHNCHTSTTPLWRRDESGFVLCNACGLFLKLHGRRRPISLKTDVIKSRNRSKNNPVAIKRTKNNQQSQLHMPNSPGINGGSPSFAAISPHVGPHGSPLNHPSHGGSPLTHGSPLRPAMLHDISHIDHMPLSGPPLQDNRPQNIGQIQRPAIPSTPSTMFSYTNSPTLGPVNGGGPHHPPPPHHHPMQQPHMNGALQPMYSQPPPHHHQLPLPHQQHPSQLPYQQPSGYTSLPGSGRASPKNYSPAPGTETTVHSPASLPPMSMGLPQQPNGFRPLPPRQQPLSTQSNRGFTNNSNGIPPVASASPHILTPQSRPQSPVNTNNNNHGLALRPLRFAGESVSEQLRPRSPDVKLDRIPSLRNMPTPGLSQPQPSSSTTPPIPTANQNNNASSALPPVSPNGATSPRSLSTRISELELINDLLRSRVSQLEAGEANARKSEATIRESELLLRKQVEELQFENKRLREMNESSTKETNEPQMKRIKVSELL